MPIPDLTTMPDTELEELVRAAVAEIERRQTLANAPAQAEQLSRRVLAAEGTQPGDPWRQPTGAHDAYPAGWRVTHNDIDWESLIPANVWEPGVGPLATTLWRDLTTQTPDGQWAPGIAYAVGDIVTWLGLTYTCRQAHTAATGWEPPAVPALWTLNII